MECVEKLARLTPHELARMSPRQLDREIHPELKKLSETSALPPIVQLALEIRDQHSHNDRIPKAEQIRVDPRTKAREAARDRLHIHDANAVIEAPQEPQEAPQSFFGDELCKRVRAHARRELRRFGCRIPRKLRRPARERRDYMVQRKSVRLLAAMARLFHELERLARLKTRGAAHHELQEVWAVLAPTLPQVHYTARYPELVALESFESLFRVDPRRQRPKPIASPLARTEPLPPSLRRQIARLEGQEWNHLTRALVVLALGVPPENIGPTDEATVAEIVMRERATMKRTRARLMAKRGG